MTVLRREGPETFMRYSSTGVTPEPPQTIRLGDFSPAIRPSTDGIRRLEDMAGELDPAFFVDGKIQREGLRSGLIVPLRRGEQVSGFVFVGSRRPGAFTAGRGSFGRRPRAAPALRRSRRRACTLDTPSNV